MKRILAALTLASLPAYASTLVNDTFSSGTANSNGYYTQSGDGTTANFNMTATISGGVLAVAKGTGTTARPMLFKQFTETTLADGETMRISFTLVDAPSSNPNQNRQFRFGLMNSINTVSSDLTNIDSTAVGNFGTGTTGYFLSAASGTATTSSIGYRTSGSSNGLINPTTWTDVDTTTAGVFTTGTGVNQTFTMNITRNSLTSVSISGSIGSWNFSDIDTGSNDFVQFDTLVLGYNTNSVSGYSFSIDNLTVETIPEPSTVGLLGLLFTGLIFRKRFQS